MLHRATVTSTSPLKIRLNADSVAGSSADLPATKATWSSYSPSVNDGVLVDFVSDNRQVIVMGKAS